MKSVLGILSGKGGSGKSTSAVGIGAALCSLGQKVLLIDLDAGLRCLDVMLDVDEGLVFDLGDVLAGTPAEQAVLPSSIPGLSLLPAPGNPTAIDGQALYRLLLSMHQFDYIILEFPAGLEFPFIEDIAEITDFLVVCTADRVGMRDSERAASILRGFGSECRLLINKYSKSLVKRGLYAGIDDLIDCSGCRLLGVIPFDAQMPLFGVAGKKSFTNNAFLRIAKRIYGFEVRLPRIEKIEKGK